MGTYDLYRNRMTLYSTPYGTSTPVENYFENNEISIINNTFAKSSSYMNIPIAGVNTDVRLVRNDKDIDNQHVKRLMFRPMTQVLEGSIAIVNSNNWLVTEFSNHAYYPTAQISQCNDYMRWKDNNGTLFEFPCVVAVNTRQAMIHQDKIALETEYKTKMQVTYNNNTSSIRDGLRVILGTRAYQIISMDSVSHVYNGNGYIIFDVQLVTFSKNDDMVNRIADNSAYYLEQQKSNGGGFGW